MSTMLADAAMPQAPATEHARSQKGNVLVEFAFILPVFLLLLFGVITISVALYDKTVLTMATREGARAGAKFVAGNTVDEQTNKRIKNAADAANAIKGHLISFGPVTPTSPTVTISNNILTVQDTLKYTGVYILSAPLKIPAQTSMRLE